MRLLAVFLLLAASAPATAQRIPITSNASVPVPAGPPAPPIGAVVATPAQDSYVASAAPDLYFFDGPSSGTDTISGWGLRDRIVTTSPLPSLHADQGNRFVLPSGGFLRLASRMPVTRLKRLGSEINSGRTYHVYSHQYDMRASADLDFASGTPEATVPATQNGVLYIAENTAVVNATINPLIVHGGYRALETHGSGATLTDSTITGVVATGVARDGIRLNRATNVIISGVRLTHSPVPSTGTNLPEGIAIYNGRDVAILDSHVTGFRMAPDCDANGQNCAYPNGDGIAIENRMVNVSIERTVAESNTDGGFDLKLGTGSWLDRIVSIDNGRGLRCWYFCEVGRYESRNDRGSAVWLGKGAQVHIALLRVTADVPLGSAIVTSEGRNAEGLDAHLVIDACDFRRVAPGTLRFKANGSGTTVSWGTGCTLP